MLAKANSLLRHKRYTSALELYAQVMQEHPELAYIIHFNTQLAEKRRCSGLYPEVDTRGAILPATEQTDLRDDIDAQEFIDGGQHQYKILATHQVERNKINPKLWDSLGEDPYFILEQAGIFDPADLWYAFSLELSSAKKQGLAKLYLDYGDGFTENDAVNLPAKTGKIAKRIFASKSVPKSLRFDPKENSGEFIIEKISIIAITEDEARNGMLQRLSELDDQFLGWGSVQIWERILENVIEAKESPLLCLSRLYDDTFNLRTQSVGYREWIETFEAESLPSPATVQTMLDAMSRKPLISIIMPVYNTNASYLRACIDSVLVQSYPLWELCIADDKSTRPYVRNILQEYENRDARIRVVYREHNGHISRASNSALEIATGEYVALLDHDDALSVHALYFMALAINEHPDVQVLYSDEDKIDTKGRRFAPHFKSDWNPDLFFSQNYVSHLGTYKRELLNRIGGFRAGVEGSQDQDLLLRCLPHVDGSQIVHIPHVLYHWRATEGSTALASGEKSYTTEAGLKALRDYFSTVNPEVRVEAGLVPNTYRARWPIPQPAPLVSLLIPTRDHRKLTETCVRSILDKTTYTNYEILILDNGSVEQTTLDFFRQIQREDKRVRVLRYDHPFNYSAINNFGVRHARGEIIGLINNDIELISPDWMTEMVSHAVRPDIGCVGAKLYYANETIQHAGVILGIGGVANHSHLKFNRSDAGYSARLICIQNYSAVTAACLFVRRTTYDEVSGLDETNLKIAFNDVDFCLKVRQAGYRNLWTPFAELYHHESISRGHEDTPEKKERFRKEVEFMQAKWGELLTADPYYNPNLTKDREDFSIGMP